MNKVAFITLGCKLNFSESSTFARQFAAAGFEEAAPGPDTDIFVVNTCSVTEHADKKCRNLIRKLHKTAPGASIVVTGCYAQLKPAEILAIEGVDLVVGADRKGDLVRLALEAQRGSFGYSCEIDQVERFFPAYSSGERTRSFLKVQDGCDYHCAYCTVPLARGKSRNIPIAELAGQAQQIAAQGILEVVLTGVNTGDFGKTTGESFLDLLKALDAVPGIERYRISSIEPNLLTEDILRWITTGTKFLPHFHIPIQSGCNRTLKGMHRRYTAEQFEAKIALIRDILEKPEERYTRVFFGIDVIVGFPGRRMRILKRHTGCWSGYGLPSCIFSPTRAGLGRRPQSGPTRCRRALRRSVLPGCRNFRIVFTPTSQRPMPAARPRSFLKAR